MQHPTNNNGVDQQQLQLQQQLQQQQQWMAAMQYPGGAAAATMMMQHQMMHHPQTYPQQYVAYTPQQQQQYQQSIIAGSVSEENNKSIWIGDLQYWMDENYLNTCFGQTGEVSSIKVIRNKQTGQSEGYGFVVFYSRAAAEKILQAYNGTLMPNSDQPFRLNWASFSTGERRGTDVGSDHSIFVGDLAPDVTDILLHETFAGRYQSVKGAKVVIDANTGRSKGYGFVRFADDNEKSRAIDEMNGQFCSSRPMRIGVATPRKATGHQQQYSSQGGYASNGASAQTDDDSANTTIFVGGLDPTITDEDLRQPFSQYGEVVSVKIPVGKGCGFVQFADRNCAEEALQNLSGTVIGKQTVRLSWGRNPANKQSRTDSGNQWNGGYYGGQAYEGYGYAPATSQDPNAYAAAAYGGAYPVYGNPQQQVCQFCKEEGHYASTCSYIGLHCPKAYCCGFMRVVIEYNEARTLEKKFLRCSRNGCGDVQEIYSNKEVIALVCQLCKEESPICKGCFLCEQCHLPTSVNGVTNCDCVIV